MRTETTSKVCITTNNVARPVIDAWELSADERAEFDYLDWESIDRGENSASFLRYKGQLYDLGEFSRVISPSAARMHPAECAAPEFQGWSGYRSDSFFSGLLVKYVGDDWDSVVVGWYCC
jgi:hypothetical protein